MKQYEITLKGEALVLAIDSGLVKESRFGKTDISAFLRFWDAFEPELKSLYAEIEHLRLELAEEKHHTRRSALVNEADLPKCQSVACYNCKYVTYLYHPENGAMYLLGCGKGLTCEDFVYTDENKPPVWKRAEDLLTTASIPKEYEEHPERGPCLRVPRPPCHVE